MPLPAGVQLYFTSADGTQRRRLPRTQIESVTTQLERIGGYGQCTVSTAIPYYKAAAITVQLGDRVETWYQGVRRYRGYVSAIAPSSDEPRKVVITAFGVYMLLRKQYCNRSYAFPGQGSDIQAAFSALAANCLIKATGPNGFRLIQSVQSEYIGTNIQALDARQKLAGDVIDALVKSAGNLAVTGTDVDAASGNRLFLRPLSPASPPVHAIPVPGRSVESSTGEQQSADIVNQLLITGGSPIYPQLLHNGGFELPVYQEAGAGNLINNGGFETNNGSAPNLAAFWAFSGGAAANTPFSFPPKSASAFAGNRFLQMEGTGQSTVQTAALTLVTGHNYVLSARAAKEIDQQIATGQITLLVQGSGGATLQTVTLALTPTGQGYDYFSASFVAPASATAYKITISCTANDASHVANNSYSGGLIVDDVQLYDNSVVYQDGWGTVAADTSQAFVNAVNWVYQDSVYEGGYSVYLDATGADSDGHDLKLEPLESSRFKVTPSQTLRAGVWLKSPPASLNPNPPKFNLEIRLYDSSGNLSHTPRTSFNPGFLAQWTYFELVCFAIAGEVAADANITWRSSGSLLVDAFSVRDAQAPAMAAAIGSTTSASPFLPDGPLVYFLAASDAYLNGTWRPANGLSNPAPYASSEAVYGPRCAVFSDSSVLQLSDACAVADATFTSQAFPLFRPSVKLVNDPRLYWPGETVNLIGADGPSLSGGTALPIARVVDTYDGLLKTRLELAKEQPDVSLVVKKIVQDELLRLGPGPTNSSSSGGYSSSAGGASGAVSSLRLQKDSFTLSGSAGPFPLSQMPAGNVKLLFEDLGLAADSDYSLTGNSLTLASSVLTANITAITFLYSY